MFTKEACRHAQTVNKIPKFVGGCGTEGHSGTKLEYQNTQFLQRRHEGMHKLWLMRSPESSVNTKGINGQTLSVRRAGAVKRVKTT